MAYRFGISGYDGSGKTHLRRAVCHHLLGDGKNTVKGTSVSDGIADYLFPKYGESVYKKPLSEELRSEFIREGLLVLEKCGTSYWIDAAIARTNDADYSVIDGIRYTWELPRLDYIIYIDNEPGFDMVSQAPQNRSYVPHLKLIREAADYVLPYRPSLSQQNACLKALLTTFKTAATAAEYIKLTEV